ncbi:pilus assembly protein [Rhizobium sp. P32RR-XVIII]|uniref:TadE/TadG family type IV pilus assembly protein n=1 Tax=Rhizobium sp. P32RR-XVIII TaxID=2726738 RepID=UPI001456FC51|nr:TadE/TadG family type IV pilus assembly protein [Rhizobium sp. P32RR-XVIII]NLS02674.1 pilus assembly protein [Rhizobium sp. P32RR-XVIII]
MREFFSRHAHRFVRDEGGNFAILTALAMVPLLGAASVAVDFTNASFEADKLQESLDSAALAAVRFFGEGHTEAEATQLANEMFAGNWDVSNGNEEATPAAQPPSLHIVYSQVGQQIMAAADYAFNYKPVFLTRLSFPISRRSSASYQTGTEACILALHPTADRAFDVSGSSKVDTSGCSITANSNSNEAIYVGGSGTLKTECLYTPGKVSASPSSIDLACGQARERTPAAIDPFKRKTMPAAGQWVDLSGCGQVFVGGGGGGTCNGTGKTPSKPPAGYSVTLKPGTYDGLEIKGNVTLQPGNYLIDGGTLKFASQSVITGDQVTFFLLNGAEIDIHGGSTFNITAPTSGAWAGFSIVADRSNTAPAVINGNSNSHLNGIIYMPAAEEVQYAGNGATTGECVRIIAQQITMTGNSTFKLDCKSELANNQINNPGAIRLLQ